MDKEINKMAEGLEGALEKIDSLNDNRGIVITGSPNIGLRELARQMSEAGINFETESAFSMRGVKDISADALDNLVIIDEQSMVEGFPEGAIVFDSIPEMRNPAVSQKDLNLVQKMQMASMYGEFGDFPQIKMSREERRRIKREEAREAKKLRREMSKQVKQQGHDPEHDFFSINGEGNFNPETREAITETIPGHLQTIHSNLNVGVGRGSGSDEIWVLDEKGEI